jgi:peptide deformylase
MVREILLLGNELLYEKSELVGQAELPALAPVANDLHDTLMAFRAAYGAGRAIAAPQIGVKKRLVYMHVEGPVVFINPVLRFPGGGMMEVLDDCMSFPGLYVRVMRHDRCVVKYRDMNWAERELALEGDLSELIQHEFDHLDGILAVMRAKDERSLVMKKRPAFN